MKGLPVITCAILCYNYGRYLGEAIESCLAQEPGNYRMEILVLDDGSTDETPEVCASFADRIRISRTENRGFGATLTRAIEEASGDFVALLDADDVFEPFKLRKLAKEFADGVAFTYHDMGLIDENGVGIGDGEGGNTSTIAFARVPALDLLPVNNELEFHILRFGCLSKYLRESLVRYRIHPKSMTDRSAPAAHSGYFSAVKLRFAEKAERFATERPSWMSDACRLRRAAVDFRVIGLTEDFEAAVHDWNSLPRMGRSFARMFWARLTTGQWHGRFVRLCGRFVIKLTRSGKPA